jgi:hypothetical protein
VKKPAAPKPKAAPEEKPAGEGRPPEVSRLSPNNSLFYWSPPALWQEDSGAIA